MSAALNDGEFVCIQPKSRRGLLRVFLYDLVSCQVRCSPLAPQPTPPYPTTSIPPTPLHPSYPNPTFSTSLDPTPTAPHYPLPPHPTISVDDFLERRPCISSCRIWPQECTIRHITARGTFSDFLATCDQRTYWWCVALFSAPAIPPLLHAETRAAPEYRCA